MVGAALYASSETSTMSTIGPYSRTSATHKGVSAWSVYKTEAKDTVPSNNSPASALRLAVTTALGRGEPLTRVGRWGGLSIGRCDVAAGLSTGWRRMTCLWGAGGGPGCWGAGGGLSVVGCSGQWKCCMPWKCMPWKCCMHPYTWWWYHGWHHDWPGWEKNGNGQAVCCEPSP